MTGSRTTLAEPDAEQADRPDPHAVPRTGSGGLGRRALLGAAGIGALTAACAPAAPTAAPPPPTSPPAPAPTSRTAAVHLANRATFGATAAVVARIQQLGVARWLDEQLDPRRLPDAESRVADYTTLRNTNAQNDVVRMNDKSLLTAELDHATLLRAVYSERQLYEVMCDFWTNHLNIWRGAKWLTQLKTLDNEQVVRRHALGKFVDLLMASAKSPAMLVYLDNYASEGQPGKHVNENYGRELLELHTLGIIDGQALYTEADVLGVAKVLSGWTINWTNGPEKYTFQFAEWAHNREPVSILGGQWSRPSRANYHDRVANAQGDGESLIRFLARHPSTARYLCWKLVRRFVSDQPPMTLVDRLAATYRANDTAIAPVLRQLFLSPEFQASVRQKVKRPMDWLISTLRVMGAEIHPAPKGHAADRLCTAATALGQPPFERVSPDGYPETANRWVSADGLLKRWEYGARIARNQLTDASKPERVDVDLAAMLPTPRPATARELLRAIANQRLQYSLSDEHAAAICTGLQLAAAAPAAALADDTTRLGDGIAMLLAHPTFQRR